MAVEWWTMCKYKKMRSNKKELMLMKLDKILLTYSQVNMIKLTNTLRKQADGMQTHIPEKYLKFNVSIDPWKTFNDQILVKVDTSTDAN